MVEERWGNILLWLNALMKHTSIIPWPFQISREKYLILSSDEDILVSPNKINLDFINFHKENEILETILHHYILNLP